MLLHKGIIYPRLPNTDGGIVLNKGQVYISVWAEDAAVSVSIIAPTATATAEGIVPVITATGATVNVSITAPTATATAEGIVPNITALVAGNVTVIPPPATAEAAGIIPTITATQTVSITAPTATATAEGVIPTVTATQTVLIEAPTATATAAAIVPVITTTSNVAITVPTATATAEGIVPTVSAGSLFVVLDIDLTDAQFGVTFAAVEYGVSFSVSEFGVSMEVAILPTIDNTVRFTAVFTNIAGVATDLDAVPTLVVYDCARTALLTTTMTRSAAGTYYADYEVDDTAYAWAASGLIGAKPVVGRTSITPTWFTE